MNSVHYLIMLCFVVLSSCLWLYFFLPSEIESAEYLKDVTSEISVIFKNLDANQDGHLDIVEFSSLKDNYKILFHNKQDVPNYEIQYFPKLPTKLGEQIIYIEAHFKPLDLNSLKKNVSTIPEDELGSLRGLLEWTKPYKTGHPFGSKSFSSFLPENANLKVGTPWWIIKPKLDKYSQPLSSKRYFPPIVEKRYHPLFALLSLFHPYPFLWTRFGPQGTAAVIRAVEKNFYDIIFRIHVEFQLNKPPLHPFWFTPSQFIGQLIINKDATVIKYFQMIVPNRKLNVDMEWLNGPTEESMEVDIGHIPLMTATSALISAESPHDLGANQNVSNIKWQEEISIETALDALKQYFFPFKEVKYYDMPSAFQLAESESKLVHGIILWGNLDDQSC